DSLLLTPLCCDDIHGVTPRVFALAGCEKSVPKKGKKKLTKKVKKEESDEKSVLKKGKKKKKQLTPKEDAHEEYLSSFPSFHARTAPSSLFSAIENSRVDILGFLTDIGFSSLHNVSIDYLPSKLNGLLCPNSIIIRLLVSNNDSFNLETLAPGLWLDANVIDCWGTGDFCLESHLIHSESHEIHSESHVIHSESHEIHS
nr:ubiquitin-specific protease 13 [Tanacetum cinerariifolium]